MAEREKLIELKDLQITFGSGKKKFVAVDHVNFDIYKGETFVAGRRVRLRQDHHWPCHLPHQPTSGRDIFFKGQKINGKIVQGAGP